MYKYLKYFHLLIWLSGESSDMCVCVFVVLLDIVSGNGWLSRRNADCIILLFNELQRSHCIEIGQNIM